MLPVMARNVLESIRLLANISRVFADRCVDGITANVEHCRFLAESSPSIVTPLNRYIGYEDAAVGRQAGAQGEPGPSARSSSSAASSPTASSPRSSSTPPSTSCR